MLTQWIAKKMNSPVVTSHPLVGGMTARVLEHELASGRTIVSREVTNAFWLEHEPHILRRERDVLQVIQDCEVVAPTFLALDESGDETEYPTLLMSKIPGAPRLDFDSFEDGLLEAADALVSIHKVHVGGEFSWKFQSYTALSDFAIPTWADDSDSWQRLINYVTVHDPNDDVVFLHRDFHPTNWLWVGDKLSGVVDWVNGCVGPALADVAHCRNNLMLLYGVSHADLFLKRYLERSERIYDPYWDIRGLFDFVGETLDVYPGWPSLGKTDLTSDLLKARANAYVESLIERII